MTSRQEGDGGPAGDRRRLRAGRPALAGTRGRPRRRRPDRRRPRPAAHAGRRAGRLHPGQRRLVLFAAAGPPRRGPRRLHRDRRVRRSRAGRGRRRPGHQPERRGKSGAPVPYVDWVDTLTLRALTPADAAAVIAWPRSRPSTRPARTTARTTSPRSWPTPRSTWAGTRWRRSARTARWSAGPRSSAPPRSATCIASGWRAGCCRPRGARGSAAGCGVGGRARRRSCTARPCRPAREPCVRGSAAVRPARPRWPGRRVRTGPLVVRHESRPHRPLPGFPGAGRLARPVRDRSDEALRLAHGEAFADHWGSAPPDRAALGAVADRLARVPAVAERAGAGRAPDRGLPARTTSRPRPPPPGPRGLHRPDRHHSRGGGAASAPC